MYNGLYFIAVASGIGLALWGLQSKRWGRAVIGVVIGIGAVLFFWLLEFWGEMLWFQALEQGSRFWKEALTRAGLAVAGAVLAWGIMFALLFRVPRDRRLSRLVAQGLALLFGFGWGNANWDTFLRYYQRVETGVTDPILGYDTGFYLFALPWYDALYALVLVTAFIALVAAFAGAYLRFKKEGIDVEIFTSRAHGSPKALGAVYLVALVLALTLAFGQYLARFHLMYSTAGVVTGPGWTDVHVRMPAYLFTGVVAAAVGIWVVIPACRRVITRVIGRAAKVPLRYEAPAVLSVAAGFLLISWFVALIVIPGLFQWLRVEPNEISFERPYIANNIEFTRQGFKLHDIEEREFPVSEEFTRKMVEDNKSLFENIRLWDWRALDAVYKQFQEIRLYFEFVDVDIDRYTFDDDYREVMISARELNLRNLPEQSQTFVNRRFKYTHGHGLTLTNVSEFTPEGLPKLLVKDIPPKSVYPELEVMQPRIYYGELTRTHVIVNSDEAEFDYPQGDENVYTHYQGNGGVEISNIWRKFLYGYKFDGTRLFLSGYPNPESRIMFHRQIEERVRELAPFLQFDNDPYIVLAEGRLYWIIDAYTTSEYYPYSEPFSSGRMTGGKRAREFFWRGASMNGVNYVRNSVKAVVDAYEGTVDLYIFDPEDPLVLVWSAIFPGLFKNLDDMPEYLRKHVRYPSDMLLIQGLVYAKYHMTDPSVFYNQEDLWVRATEKYYASVQPVEPYYIMWERPGSDEQEFVLILPFTPKNRQVLIGWIAGMCDGEDYGRLLAYKFPKEKRVLGTQQVETKIDQNPYLSERLTLWNQQGSRVIRGNVLAIPIDETLIYVEPIYLQADTAAYPELRLVVVMHDDRLSYAETFDKALEGLFAETAPAPEIEAPPGEATMNDLIRQANQHFDDYLAAMGEGQFENASKSMEELQDALEQLADLQGGGAAEGSPEGGDQTPSTTTKGGPQ